MLPLNEEQQRQIALSFWMTQQQQHRNLQLQQYTPGMSQFPWPLNQASQITPGPLVGTPVQKSPSPKAKQHSDFSSVYVV